MLCSIIKITRKQHILKTKQKLLKPQDMYERTVIIFLDGVIDFYTGNQAVGQSESFGFAEMYRKKYDEIIKKPESL